MTADHSLFVEPDDCRGPLLQALAAAQGSIVLTIYELTDADVIAALLAARARGVAVSVIYNWCSFTQADQQGGVMAAVRSLAEAGAQCQPASAGFEVTHEKAFVIDGTTAIVMSLNLMPNYFGKTRDFAIITSVPAEVAEIAVVFQADQSFAPITPTQATLVWSPVNARSRLTQLISNAQYSLDIYCEEVSDPGILAALVAAARRQVRVRLIAAVLGSPSNNGNARGINTLQQGGVDAGCKDFLYIHAKMILADAGQPGAQAYVGSENFSSTSLDKNRECGILVQDAGILDRLATVFTADWARPDVIVSPAGAPPVATAG